MSHIQIMPEVLANQIAAGEVIERPASVVKELVENAIDAKSSQINIDIKEAGLDYIEVTDNGQGMDREDAENAFQRHATSKLLSQEDLFRIRSLGFRGEALPSIASVSEMTLETGTGDGEGTFIELKGGEIVEKRPAASRKGTKIRVENLFFNTPARLKYIKAIQTELSHITEAIQRFAFSNPEISFRLHHNDNLLIQTVGNGDLRQAIASVYGVKVAKKMLAIEAENFDFEVEGFVSLPEVSRSNRRYTHIIVNGRTIRNIGLSKALEAGYGSKLMINRHPIAVLSIKMDPLLLDVNVHPTKQEIRISNEKDLTKLVQEAVEFALQETVRIPQGLENIDQNKRGQEKTTIEQLNFENSLDDFTVSERPLGDPPPAPFYGGEEVFPDFSVSNSPHLDFGPRPDPRDQGQDYQPQNQPSYPGPDFQDHETQDVLKVAQKSRDLPDYHPKSFPQLDYIGQMHGTYLFGQNEEGLYIIDQHAAQERIKYEYYREEIGKQTRDQQDLLFPIVLEYPANESMVLKENLDLLKEVGIYLEDFGQNTFIMRSHPTWFIQGQEESTVKEMIDFFLEKKSINLSEFLEATAIMMSCKRSIKANHYLPAHEARQLLVDLEKCQNPYNCPHGRPVLVFLSSKDMEKMFKRIQD